MQTIDSLPTEWATAEGGGDMSFITRHPCAPGGVT